MIAIDLETTGLDYINDSIFCLTWSRGKREELVMFDEFIRDKSVWQEIFDKEPCIFHNAKFDMHFLKRAGFRLPKEVHDTMIIAALLDERMPKKSLAVCCKKFLGVKNWKDETEIYFKKGLGAHRIPFNLIKDRAEKDTLYTYKLFETIYPKIKEQKLTKVYNIEQQLIEVLVEMEDEGMQINPIVLQDMLPKLEDEIFKAEEEIYKITGYTFNIDSGIHLQKLLYNYFALPIIKYTNDRKRKNKNKPPTPSTDIQTLRNLQKYTKSETIKILLQNLIKYSEAYTICNTFAKPLLEKAIKYDNILHCSFGQVVPRTGRMSCFEPNLQNIPKSKEYDIRKAFVSRPKMYNVCFDYSQMEVIGTAYYTEDVRMIQNIYEGKDVHLDMAKIFYNNPNLTKESKERDMIKGLNFGIFYGMGAKGISEKFNISYEKAKEIRNRYMTMFPTIQYFNNKIKEKILFNGYTTNVFGRRRRLTSEQTFLGLNTLVQGTCADIVKRAMIKVYQFLKRKNAKSKILLQIHDEIKIQMPEEELILIPRICRLMEFIPEIDLPFKVDVEIYDTNWREKKPFNIKEVI